MNRNKTFRIALCGILTAIMLVLGFIESQFPLPVPVPGIKLGLSNTILLFAVYMLDVPTAFVLMLLKVTLSGLLFGGVSAMLYALAGGVVSVAVMSLLSRPRRMSVIVVSMLGGAAHNAAQTFLAMAVTRTDLSVYLGILLLVGLACGALTGVCAIPVMKHVRLRNGRGK
ncbi:MAG: Gx transporter family protein [Clostridia bacterium]|nr:Gx transporter family protein [Clostridia bacterium]